MALIELKDITKTYRSGDLETPVLRGISLVIEKGELVALMGASGSGKTTLMNVLGCLDQPTSGEYWFEGQEVGQLSSDERAVLRSRRIGFVFQNFNLLARTSAIENVLMPVAYAPDGPPKDEIRRRAKALLERVGLGERLAFEPSKLSGGQQQRVAVARSLINTPSLLLADEPTGALDSRSSAELLKMIEELNEEQGLTMLIVTHDEAVAHHARRIVKISDGRIVEDGVPARPVTVAGGAA